MLVFSPIKNIANANILFLICVNRVYTRNWNKSNCLSNGTDYSKPGKTHYWWSHPQTRKKDEPKLISITGHVQSNCTLRW